MKIECYTTMQDGVKVYVIREAHEGPGRSKQLSFYVNDKGEFVRCRVRNAKSSPSKPSAKRGNGVAASAKPAISKSVARRNTTTGTRILSRKTTASKTANASAGVATNSSPRPTGRKSTGRGVSKKSA